MEPSEGTQRPDATSPAALQQLQVRAAAHTSLHGSFVRSGMPADS